MLIPKERIYNSSWKESCPVLIEELSYLRPLFWGFDDTSHEGELIVHQKVANEILEIFHELFQARFPIEKMRLIDDYGANDHASMADNNSSGFCFRKAVEKNVLSKHSYGLAVDINPLYNPYIKGDLILPPEGKAFVARDLNCKGLINKNGVCYRAFKKRGWIWGGEFVGRKDYHHFEKGF